MRSSPPANSVEAAFSVLEAPERLVFDIEILDDATLAPDELLCETEFTAISPGTEIAAYRGLEPLRPTEAPYPRLVGYLNAARVLAVGSELTESFHPGERVLSFTSHRSHFKTKAARVCATIPDQLPSRNASLAYLYRLALSGLRRGQFATGKSVAVIGLGPIGLCALRLAVLGGGRIYGFSGFARTRSLAESLEATALAKDSEDDLGRLREETSGGVDLVISTTNAWHDWELAVSLPRFNGVVSVLGFPGRGEPPPRVNPLASMHFYERQLACVAAGMAPSQIGSGREEDGVLRADMADILAQMVRGELMETTLIADELPGRELEHAYRSLLSHSRDPGTIVLRWT